MTDQQDPYSQYVNFLEPGVRMRGPWFYLNLPVVQHTGAVHEHGDNVVIEDTLVRRIVMPKAAYHAAIAERKAAFGEMMQSRMGG